MSWAKVGNITGPPGPPGGTVVQGTQYIMGETPTGTLNGINKVFAAANAFAPNSLEVFLNGLRQRRVDDYTETSSTQFTFVTAPKATDTISIDYILPAATLPVVGEIPTGALNGTNKIFTTAYIYKPTLLAVFLSGLRLRHPDDYTETGSQTFQLVTAPLSSDSLCVDYFQP